jgi:hypothetical protein
VEAVGYLTTAIILCFLIICFWVTVSSLFKGKKKKPPKLAGTAIPETGEGLDIGKRYDIIYSGGDYGSQFTERLQGVRIVGYIGKDDDEPVGKMYLQSRWLVVEFADGRRAYLMPHSIVSLQESASE